MNLRDPRRWRCDCSRISHEVDMLYALNPFDSGDTINGCPHCKQIGQWTEVCDEKGCNDSASSGTPVAGSDYRRTCHKHVPREFCPHCGAGVGHFRRNGEGTCHICDPKKEG
jgi:hypothetical protein